jgi:hypothetical protein
MHVKTNIVGGRGRQRRQQVYANSNTLFYTWGVHGILAMIVEKIKKILEDLLENILNSRHFITIFHKNSGAHTPMSHIYNKVFLTCLSHVIVLFWALSLSFTQVLYLN